MVYIDGSFVKHKIPVKPIYITLRNLNSVVSGKAAAWRVLGIMPTLRKSATLEQTDTWRKERSLQASCGCIMQVSPTSWRCLTSLQVRISTCSALMFMYKYVCTEFVPVHTSVYHVCTGIYFVCTQILYLQVQRCRAYFGFSQHGWC